MAPFILTLEIILGDMDLDNAHFLSASPGESDESKKLVLKASCDFEHDAVMVSKGIFIKEKHSLKKSPL